MATLAYYAPWQINQAPQGIYFFNEDTGDSTWHPPNELQDQLEVKLMIKLSEAERQSAALGQENQGLKRALAAAGAENAKLKEILGGGGSPRFAGVPQQSLAPASPRVAEYFRAAAQHMHIPENLPGGDYLRQAAEQMPAMPDNDYIREHLPGGGAIMDGMQRVHLDGLQVPEALTNMMPGAGAQQEQVGLNGAMLNEHGQGLCTACHGKGHKFKVTQMKWLDCPQCNGSGLQDAGALASGWHHAKRMARDVGLGWQYRFGEPGAAQTPGIPNGYGDGGMAGRVVQMGANTGTFLQTAEM